MTTPQSGDGRQDAIDPFALLADADADYLRQLLAAHPTDVGTLHTLDGRVVYASGDVERLLGYTPVERVGSDGFELVHPDDVAELRAHSARVAGDPDRGVHHVTYRMRRKDGHWTWLESASRLIPGTARTGPLVASTSRDVSTLRASAELWRVTRADLAQSVADRTAALEEASARLREECAARQRLTTELQRRVAVEALLARLATDLLVLPGEQLETGLTAALRRIAEFCGVERAYLIDLDDTCWIGHCAFEWCAAGVSPLRPVLQGVRLADYPWMWRTMQARADINVPDVMALPPEAAAERRVCQRDGVGAVLCVPAIVAPRLLGYLGVATAGRAQAWDTDTVLLLSIVGQLLGNVAARARTEQALRDSEARYRGLVETQADLIIRLDTAHRFTFANDAFCEKFGRPQAALLGQPLTTLVGASDQPAVLDALRRVHDPPYRVSLEQNGWTVGDGPRVFSWEAYALRNAADEVVEIQAVGRDITRLVRAEEEARRHRNELAHVDRLNAIGALASNLAHELNQPLSAAGNYLAAAQLRLRGGPTDTGEARADLAAAVAQVKRAGEYLRHIKDFIRQREPQRAVVDLNDVVRRALSFVEDLTRSNGIRVTCALAPALPPVLADRVQIEQVLLNLVRNAIEALATIPPPAARQIDVRTDAPLAGQVRVCVQDSGPGVAPEVAAHLFDAFHTTKPGGTGLGLSISRSIIEAHGGRLSAAPAGAAGGALFSFTLPSAEDGERDQR